jgi:mannosyl-oligosaccharide alpha-1,3-glucosidase
MHSIAIVLGRIHVHRTQNTGLNTGDIHLSPTSISQPSSFRHALTQTTALARQQMKWELLAFQGHQCLCLCLPESPSRPGKCRHKLLLSLLLIITAASMAVDRSKFRTCQQTSFCRRHRQQEDGTPNHSHVTLFHYQVLPDSIRFHLPEDTAAEHQRNRPNPNPKHTKDKGTGVWQSLQRRLLGKQPTNDNSAEHVPGPPPTLTATLQNMAATVTTTNNNNNPEHLVLSVTALSDGMARIRITEVYGIQGTAHQQARVTYDNLVLQSLVAAHHAQWWWQAGGTTTTSNDNVDPAKMNQNHHHHHHPLPDAMIQALGGAAAAAIAQDGNNYAALQFGSDGNEDTVVLLQLNPFVLTVHRQGQALVQLNGKDLMHFEIRRWKSAQQQPQQNDGETVLVHEDDDQDAPKSSASDTGKEIVGYWEDGLAIYADGTREEKTQEAATPYKEENHIHRQLLVTEPQPQQQQPESSVMDTDGMWEESFGSHTDSKPFGPTSVGLDIAFPHSQHLFGLPEHASSALLQTTRGSGATAAHYKEPYRLYNLDVFEYELDETMALYGSIPFIVSVSSNSGSSPHQGSAVGVFWFNPSETFVDIVRNDDSDAGSMTTHWMSESGVVDVFVLPGSDPASLYRQYAQLTGTTPLPPIFSLGYHQCRWNYKDEKDVYQVHGMFEELDYPYDVLWLDIEHTDGKRYFTWDKALFPNPLEMQDKLATQGRRMVTIVDPHMKRDTQYYIHKEATAKGLYIKDKEGKNDYDGWCWPGSSSYLDFTAEHVRSWWADQFHFSKYVGSTPSLFTWNDMNEPSVFNGPEVSMNKDLRNLKGEEHREWHNLYGMLFHRATSEGLIRRNVPGENVRPFVLSRAFFAGSQRYGAIWTGDNKAEWSHLQIAAPMLLSMNTAALTFVGADVGGFFGDPDAELFTRWMQAGAYQPFFRGHAHHDSKRREPWTFDDDTMKRLRQVTMARYALLPYWYTVFRKAEMTGMPVMRMMWMEYPNTVDLFAVDDQYLIGADLLVKPVTAPGAVSATVQFPTDHLWYDATSLVLVSSKIQPAFFESKEVPADIDTIPVFQRGGSIIPRKLRLRRSSMVMKHDPYTLYVALDENNKAQGELYMDDEETFGYQRKFEQANATFTADFGGSKAANTRTATMSCSVSIGSGWVDSVSISLATHRMVERIIVMGVTKSPKKITRESESIRFTFSPESQLLVLHKPDISALAEWSISVHM